MNFKHVIVALVLAVLGVFAGAPYYTAHQIKQAVNAGDAAALARHVDFERVRTSLKRQLADGVARHLPEGARSGVMAELGAVIASRATDAALQAFITPEGVSDLLAGRMSSPFAKPAGDGAGEPNRVDPQTEDGLKPSARYVGWDRFQVQLPARGRTVNLMLSREGVLNWKLTDIDLSDLW